MNAGRFLVVTALMLSGACSPAVRESARAFDGADWTREAMPLGASTVVPDNVVLDDRVIRLVADGAHRTGAAVRTRSTYDAGDFRASMRCSAPRGAVCAFFLYQTGVGDRADEIDIELLAGTPDIWLTTWVRGERTNHERITLPFDPADGFHVYGMAWHDGVVAFEVDGIELHRFVGRVPDARMSLFANAWWPTWLDRSAARGELEVEWIERPAPPRNAFAHGS